MSASKFSFVLVASFIGLAFFSVANAQSGMAWHQALDVEEWRDRNPRPVVERERVSYPVRIQADTMERRLREADDEAARRLPPVSSAAVGRDVARDNVVGLLTNSILQHNLEKPALIHVLKNLAVSENLNLDSLIAQVQRSAAEPNSPRMREVLSEGLHEAYKRRAVQYGRTDLAKIEISKRLDNFLKTAMKNLPKAKRGNVFASLLVTGATAMGVGQAVAATDSSATKPVQIAMDQAPPIGGEYEVSQKGELAQP